MSHSRLTSSPASPSGGLTVSLASKTRGTYLSSSVPSSKSIPAGRTTASFTLGTDDDNVDENTGSVKVTVSTGTGYAPGNPTSATVKILGNDDPPPPPPTAEPTARPTAGAHGCPASQLSRLRRPRQWRRRPRQLYRLPRRRHQTRRRMKRLRRRQTRLRKRLQLPTCLTFRRRAGQCFAGDSEPTA